MNVMKFGGTSLGTTQRIKNVANLIIDRGKNFVVLSAMSGTTNSLLQISDHLYKGKRPEAEQIINELERKYFHVINDLFSTETFKNCAYNELDSIIGYLRSLNKPIFSVFDEKEVVARGEMISTMLMHLYLKELGVNVQLIPALDFMQTDKNGEPDGDYIKIQLSKLLKQHSDADVFITQGFICRNAYGEIDNLQRGGSDYTASLVGAAIDADEIQIWTDIDGMHNNDPRFVEGTRPVDLLDFNEAAELAYFGAKILHPTCILPAKVNNIPVRLLNTMCPEAKGTIICNTTPHGTIKAIAAKDNITAIKIKSGRMLLAYGFLRKVFEIFETYQTPIDMIATSEVGVSVTIDNQKNVNAIVADLNKFGTVTVDRDMVIICVVGDMTWTNRGFEAAVVGALRDIPIRMISYGGSNYNISLLVHESDKVQALKLLSENLFN